MEEQNREQDVPADAVSGGCGAEESKPVEPEVETAKKALAEDMVSIINFADSIAAIDTTGIEATAHIAPLSNVFREDNAVSPFTREELLKAAPTTADGYVTVPRVVE